jgi:putative transposase
VRDDKLLEATLDAIVLERPEPTEDAPQHLCLDKGYDNQLAREVVEENATTSLIFGASERRSWI